MDNNTEGFKKEFDDLLKKYNLEMNITTTGYHDNIHTINFYRNKKFDKDYNEVYPEIDVNYGGYYNPNNP